jgi:PIN domain nuclease of toxin-antitoxin system
MKLLVDTHYLLWALIDPGKLDSVAREALENAQIPKVVSAVSFWEISIKFALGKLHLSGTTPEEICAVAEESGFEQIALDPDVAATAHRLPAGGEHRDPFDRMLVWQAIQQDYTLLSADTRVALYEPHGLKRHT